jgi:Tfp pilus assembly protein PilF
MNTGLQLSTRQVVERCAQLAHQGAFDEAERLYREALVRAPFEPNLYLGYALLKRDADERDDASMLTEHGLRQCGRSRDLLTLKARLELERGHDAICSYRDALSEAPDDTELLLGLASAQLASGATSEAIAELGHALQQHPLWIAGHVALAKARWEYCGDSGFDDAFRVALRQHPRHYELHFGYCGMLASGLLYDRLLTAVSDARSAIGPHPILDMFEAQALAESGQDAIAERIFARLEPITDPSFAAIRMRSLLRAGRPDEAAALGEHFLSHPMANFIWPLMGLAWRETDSARWRWLNGFDYSVSTIDLPIPPAQLAALAGRLRQLHSSQQYPMDLSARGGTQTRLNLLERSEPAFAALRRLLRDAVRQYVDGLPASDPDHPFLSKPRGHFRFAGSWSIRLRDAGHHIAHVHPSGWISSALYISLPQDLDHGRQEGWLALGGSPPELGLDHDPVARVQPKPGRLVLFPSIMWHETLPFTMGERLTVAFDIAPSTG